MVAGRVEREEMRAWLGPQPNSNIVSQWRTLHARTQHPRNVNFAEIIMLGSHPRPHSFSLLRTSSSLSTPTLLRSCTPFMIFAQELGTEIAATLHFIPVSTSDFGLPFTTMHVCCVPRLLLVRLQHPEYLLIHRSSTLLDFSFFHPQTPE
jgi:hypothetical protein